LSVRLRAAIQHPSTSSEPILSLPKE
jgi:hypothetical protein